jgi:hypothetical protein
MLSNYRYFKASLAQILSGAHLHLRILIEQIYFAKTTVPFLNIFSPVMLMPSTCHT